MVPNVRLRFESARAGPSGGPGLGGTLRDFVLGLAQHGQRSAIFAVDVDGRPTSMSYAELIEAAGDVAERLVRAGIGANTPVILMAPSRPAWVIARLALLLLGALAVPIDDLITDSDLSHALRNSGARHALTIASNRARIQSVDSACTVIPLDDGISGDGRTLDGVPDATRVQSRCWATSPIDADAPAALFYTSGTTGPPKGVPLSHRNILANLGALVRANLIDREDRVLLPLPLHHSYPFLVGMLLPLAVGASVVFPSGIGGPEIIAALRSSRATTMVGVPRLYEALLAGIEARMRAAGRLSWALFRLLLAASMWLGKHVGVSAGRILFRPFHEALAPSLRLMGCGGAWLDPEIEWRLRALGWTVLTGYGLVETTSIATFNLPDQSRVGSAGRPVPGVEIALDDPNREGQGEVLIRGPGVFAGYHNDPEATRAAFTGDGWFRSGDIGRIDSERFLFIVGRVKELIVLSDGKNVSPENLEAHYSKSPYVREIAILERKGSLVALVRPDLQAIQAAGSSRFDQVLRVALAEASQILPSFQRITGHVIVHEPLPQTRLGKFKRHELGAIYERVSTGTGRRPAGAAANEALATPLARAIWAWLQERFPEQVLASDTVLQLDLGVDSLAWIDLGLALEARFGIALPEDAFARIVTLADLVREIEEASQRGAAKPATRISLADLEAHWLAPPAWPIRFVAVLLYALNWLAMRLLFQLRIEGRGNVPVAAPFVLVSNHQSDIDAFVLAAVLPRSAARRLSWGGDVTRLFQSASRRLLARAAGVFPIDDRAGEQSVALARRALALGRSLVWFPEGWRSPDGRLQPFLPGIGHILRDFPGPVVPVRIEGAFEALPRGRRLPRPGAIQVRFGMPVRIGALPGGAPADAPALAQILRTLVAALEEAAPPDKARSP